MFKIYLATILCFLFVTAKSQNCTVNAGADYSICASQVLTLSGGAAGSLSATPIYQWTKISGPAATIVSPNSLSTSATNYGVGVYVFQLTGTCADGNLAKDQVTITVIADVTTPNAGLDFSVCTAGTSTLTGNAVAAGETGAWVLTPTTATVNVATNTLTNTGATTATLKYTTQGVKQVIWRISNASCSKDDTLNISVLLPGTISAGAGKTYSCSGSLITLAGSNPGLLPQIGTWSLVSGPNNPVFSNINLSNSTVGNLVIGTYVFKWTVSGPCLNSSSTVSIVIADINPAPSAGTAQNYTQNCSSAGVTEIRLAASVNLQVGQTSTWTQTSGPALVAGSIATPTNSSNTLIKNLDGSGASTYIFTYTVTNTATGCTASTLHTVYFPTPITNVVVPATVGLSCGSTSTAFNTSFAGGGTTTNLTRSLTYISGPVATFVSGNIVRSGNLGADTWTLSNFTLRGTYNFRLQYTDACTSIFKLIQVFVSATPPNSNAGSDQLLPCNQLSTSLVGSAPGTLNTARWSQVNGPNMAVIISPTTVTTPISGLVTGVYIFRWTISGGTACFTSQDDVTVTVSSPAVVPANAGVDQSVCALIPIKLLGNQPATTQTGVWTAIPSAGVVFTNSNDPNSIVGGLQPNTLYTLIWTISNACSSSSDSTIYNTNGNTIAMVVNAGADQCLATGIRTLTLTGNAPTAGVTGLWTALNGGVIANATSAVTTATITADGTYTFVYQQTRTGCTAVTDTVVYTVAAATSAANAGADQNLCTVAAPFVSVISATVPVVGVGTWSLVAGDGSAVIAVPSAASTSISNLLDGSYIFRYTISNGACVTNTDDVQINVGIQPTTAIAGPSQSKCSYISSTVTTLAANAPTIGTGVWTVTSAPPGAATPTFSSATSPTSTVSGFVNGAYVLTWTISNGSICTPSSSDVAITISATASSSLTTSSYCNVTSANLTGNAGSKGSWTWVSATANKPTGAADPTIDSLTTSTAVANGLVPGVYKLFTYTIAAAGACPLSSVTFTLTNSALPTTANAGADVGICAGVTSATLTGNAPTTGTGAWTVVSGAAPLPVIVNGTSPNTNIASVTGLIGGLYDFKFTTTNGACKTDDDMLLISEVQANAGRDTALCAATSFQLQGNAPAYNPSVWSQVSGPNTASFNNVNLTVPTVSNLIPGTYVFQYNINAAIGSAACASSADQMTLIVSPTITANAGSAIVKCASDASSPTLGTAAQAGVNYSWLPIANLSSATVAQPNFTTTTPGSYSYTLNANNAGCSSSASTSVQVVAVATVPVTDAPTAGLCGSGTQLVTISNADYNATYTWPGALGTGVSKTIGVGTYSITASNGFCTDVVGTAIILPQRDFGDLSAATWPIASAGINSCLFTGNVPTAYNATTNPNIVVWAGAKISIEPTTINGGTTDASTDTYDDGLIAPAVPISVGISSNFGLRLFANKSATTVYYRVWFDWNADGNFTNDNDGTGAAATYTGSSITSLLGTTVNFGVIPPVGASSTSYKVRVLVSDATIADLYRINGSNTVIALNSGEVEDYSVPVILPVTGIRLVGMVMGQKVHLTWQTLTESNNNGFDIESSQDGATFKKIGFVAGAGNSTTIQYYQAYDDAVFKGTNVFYRLRQIDMDGHSYYSNTISVALDELQKTTLFPNPSHNVINIKTGTNTKSIITVFDAVGKALMQTYAVWNATLDISRLANGSYLANILHSDGSKENMPFIKN